MTKKKINFKIVSSDSYGMLTVTIDNKYYQYQIEGYQIERVRDLAKYSGYKALTYLKQATKETKRIKPWQ